MWTFLASIPGAVVAGRLLGGRLRRFGALRFRWPLLGMVGLILLGAPTPGPAGAALLCSSFVLLVAFTLLNARHPGFRLALLGLTLNLLVIWANQGMPVDREAVIASGQGAALWGLPHDPGDEHHVATSTDVLLPLADVIPLGPPVGLVVSAGDVITYAGLLWFVVGAMRAPHQAAVRARRREEARPRARLP